MKYLKYTLGVIAVMVLAFFLIGMVKSELKYECEVIVDKSLAESWAVSQDVDKMADWLIGFQKMEHVSGTPGTVGAVSDVYFTHEGQDMTIRETITEIAPNESITMLFESDFMDMDYKIGMEPIDGKTKISSSTTAVGNGSVAKSIMALMGGSIKAQEEINLANLKKTIEENTTNYLPAEN